MSRHTNALKSAVSRSSCLLQVVRELVLTTTDFRLLALSATPGSDVKVRQSGEAALTQAQFEPIAFSDHKAESWSLQMLLLFQGVQQIVSNLLVSRIQMKMEDDIDIRPYTHERKVEKVVVKLGGVLKSIQDKYSRVWF